MRVMESKWKDLSSLGRQFPVLANVQFVKTSQLWWMENFIDNCDMTFRQIYIKKKKKKNENG